MSEANAFLLFVFFFVVFRLARLLIAGFFLFSAVPWFPLRSFVSNDDLHRCRGLRNVLDGHMMQQVSLAVNSQHAEAGHVKLRRGTAPAPDMSNFSGRGKAPATQILPSATIGIRCLTAAAS